MAAIHIKSQHASSVQMVENCGTDDQKVYRSADEIPYDAGYYSLLIIKEDN